MPSIELTTFVLPGGKIEIRDSRLIEGSQIRIICTEVESSSSLLGETNGMSIVDLLRQGPPGGPLFASPAELDAAIEQERQAWD